MLLTGLTQALVNISAPKIIPISSDLLGNVMIIDLSMALNAPKCDTNAHKGG